VGPNKEWVQIGNNYKLKGYSLWAARLILIGCLGIYAVLIKTIQ